MSPIYRVQDREGRGPFKPGVSRLWSDDIATPHPPTFIEEFGPHVLWRAPEGHHIGCGFRTPEQGGKWFTRTECERLARLGYELVRVDPDQILAESEHQVVFSRRKPLALGTRCVPWRFLHTPEDA